MLEVCFSENKSVVKGVFAIEDFYVLCPTSMPQVDFYRKRQLEQRERQREKERLRGGGEGFCQLVEESSQAGRGGELHISDLIFVVVISPTFFPLYAYLQKANSLGDGTSPTFY